MNRKTFDIGLLCCLALAGCNKSKDVGAAPADSTTVATRPANTFCNSVEEQDLEKTARCLYMGHPSDPWRILSKESQSECGPRDEFNASIRDIAPPVAVRVLGVENKDGRTFGRVELIVDGQGCKSTKTHSWIQEDGTWKLVRLPRQEELFSQQFRNGDYSAALATAERWLSLDPFSLGAYKSQIFAIARGGRKSQTTRSLSDTVRAALAVNPVDSTGLFTAVTFTDDPDVAESIFEKFAIDDCSREAAAFNLAGILGPRRRLAFLDKLGSQSPLIQMRSIETMTILGEKKRLESALTQELDKNIREHLDRGDGSYAAMWSISMGKAYLALNKRDSAKSWASYAATRDPTLPEVAWLVRKVRN